MTSSKIGEEIRKARKSKGYTLRELSKKTGISHPYLSQLENGHNENPSAAFLRDISDALEAPIIQIAIDNAKNKITDYEKEISILNKKLHDAKRDGEPPIKLSYFQEKLKDAESGYYASNKEYADLTKAKNVYFVDEIAALSDDLPDKIPVTVYLPPISYETDVNGVIIERSLVDNANELRKRVFDLHELLEMDIPLRYKNEILTNESKTKIKILLQTILE